MFRFIIFIFFSFLICFIMLLGGWLLGGRSISRSKNIPFESGAIAYGSANLRFSIQFYLLSILFVIFDIESLYLYTWSVNIKIIGWLGFCEVFIFIFTLLLSLIYIINEKIFEWGVKKNNII
ncbi:NADH-quinone oxidoreductase subunit A [Buchnera aphidicola]|uniref:NADH-quinone oxidoreductase subunit A n=1 Tax=Buchnera aphidicola TaxID=9 RepID=UPI0034643591